MSVLNVRNTTRQRLPGLPFAHIAAKLLPGWEISLVFVGETRAKNLNILTRSKTYTPNVLSYEVGAKHGEIIICPSVAARQAPDFELSTHHFILLLFIHGLLHLKGYRHGTTMEKYERKILAQFAGDSACVYEQTNRNRNRYRDASRKDGRRRRSGR